MYICFAMCIHSRLWWYKDDYNPGCITWSYFMILKKKTFLWAPKCLLNPYVRWLLCARDEVFLKKSSRRKKWGGGHENPFSGACGRQAMGKHLAEGSGPYLCARMRLRMRYSADSTNTRWGSSQCPGPYKEPVEMISFSLMALWPLGLSLQMKWWNRKESSGSGIE